MDDIELKLNQMADNAGEMNPIEMWMRSFISEREAKKAEVDEAVADAEDMKDSQPADEDIDAIINLLDSYNASGGSRMKIDVTEGDGEVISKQYHHGRCDVCSPFANGDTWDVIEPS